MQLESFAYTEAGGRDENQDSIGVRERVSEGFYVVADGLGGHRLGNLASQIVVSSLLESWDAAEDWNAELFQKAIGQTNDVVLAMQKSNSCNAKSTVVALSVRDGQAIWANSGDSRLYHIVKESVKGRIVAITEDHSVAYMKYKAGEITRDQIAWDEDQSSLLRVLGNETRWKPNVSKPENICVGDAFLLCSDGLWEYVSDDEILAACLRTESAEEWANTLLEQAGTRFKQKRDNLSLITVKVTG